MKIDAMTDTSDLIAHNNYKKEIKMIVKVDI